jgi:hypothetical protein
VKVKISDTLSFEYLEGEWHILILKENKDKTIKEKTEYYGDINRCISALPKYNLANSYEYKRLYFTYKTSLQNLLPIKDAEFKKVSFKSVIGQEFISYPDVSNANILLDFAYSTDHGMSESGIKKGKQYLTSFYQVATYLLGIEVGESLRKQGEEHTVDELISTLEETQENLQRTFSY